MEGDNLVLLIEAIVLLFMVWAVFRTVRQGGHETRVRREKLTALPETERDIAQGWSLPLLTAYMEREMSFEQAKAVSQGIVAIGMNERAVRLAWGNPNDAASHITAQSKTTTWLWFGPHRSIARKVVFDARGRVIEIVG